MRGCRPIVYAMIGTTKNIVGNGAMALGNQNYIRRNNNQLTADVCGTSDRREEGRRLGRVGGVSSRCLGHQIERRKEIHLG